MSQEFSQTDNQEAAGQPNWRERLKEMGKKGFELAEMERLGFWPPNPEAAARTAEAQNDLKALQQQLHPLRKQLRELEKEIAETGDVQRLLADVRSARIERVRQARAERKLHKACEREERAAQDKAWRAETLPHLGREVSAGLNYEGGDATKLQINGATSLQTAAELALALGITTGKLAWLTYHRGAATMDHYHHFQIPKRSGGLRNISAPKKELKSAQRWVLDNTLTRVPVHEAAAAFLPGKNIAHNAERHAGAEVVVRIDLQDFFPSITFKRVKKTFQSLGYNEGIASLLALLCTEAPRTELAFEGKTYHIALSQRFLPQGACTSPALTNILCRSLDARLAGAARKLGFTYSRYADDLVFSSNQKTADVRALQTLAVAIIEAEKFTVNTKKTAIMRGHQRQSVTGLVINTNKGAAPGVRPSRRDLKSFRAFLHQYEKLGRDAMSDRMGQDALSYARGYWAFVYMCCPQQATKLRTSYPWLGREE